MGKFERRMRKQVKSEVDDYSAWLERNESRLEENKIRFNQTSQAEVVVLKKRQKIIFCLIGALIVLCVILLSVLLAKPRTNEFTFFADDELTAEDVTPEDIKELKERDVFLSSMAINSGRITRYIQSGAIVFARISCEVEYTDYYLCEMQIVFDKRYQYFAEDRYSNLSNSITGQNGKVSYRNEGISDLGLYQYTVVVTFEEASIYMDIQCFEESIVEFAEECFNIKEG